MAQDLLSTEYMTMIATGILVGTGARISTIKEDTRQYPSYPNGVFINVVTGLIAATIGAVFPITLITKNFVGVSFLMLAVQQFRDVRKTERESLNDLEKTEFTPRGSAYIDGIAKTFESRNYLALICSLLSVTVMLVIPGDRRWLEIPLGVVIPVLALYLLRRFTKGKKMGDFTDVKLAAIKFEGSMLYVDDIPVANVGLPEAQELLLQEGIGVIISPRTVGGQVAIANYGQRQTVIHEAARTFGLKRYLYMRRDFRTGRFCFAIVPIRRDEGALLELVAEVPLLESTRKSERLRNPAVLPDSKGD
jgi:hypothetical protein